jgi:hypothetical protein
MEEHFLKEFVAEEKRQAPEPWYNPDGDCIIYQVSDDAVVADRIDEVLTIYRSALDDRPIGYQIKGVLALAKMFGWDGVLVECKKDHGELKEVSLFALLLAAYEHGPKTIRRRKAYANAFESFAGRPRLSATEFNEVLA